MGLNQTVTIYGECIGKDACTPVTISALDSFKCELHPHIEFGCIERPHELWIGAIGPLPITAENRGAGRYRARFDEPLDERIIAHFATF